MRREERVTVQGPVKEQQPDGMSHRGGVSTLSPPAGGGPYQSVTGQQTPSAPHLKPSPPLFQYIPDRGPCWWCTPARPCLDPAARHLALPRLHGSGPTLRRTAGPTVNPAEQTVRSSAPNEPRPALGRGRHTCLFARDQFALSHVVNRMPAKWTQRRGPARRRSIFRTEE